MTTVKLRPIGKWTDVRRLAVDSQSAIDESLNSIGRFGVQRYDEVVSNWKHKPKFTIRRSRYTVDVDITGPNARIFSYVDQGTRAHLIRAKRRPLLKFRGGYQAKTRVNNTKFKGSGQASGRWMSKRVVHHPGSKARNFTRIIRNQTELEGRRILRTNLQKRRIPV